jgi:hypothetical protein
MKNILTKERPKTNEERLYDWKLRKKAKKFPVDNSDNKFLRVMIITISLLVITATVFGIMVYLSSNVTPVYPILR